MKAIYSRTQGKMNKCEGTKDEREDDNKKAITAPQVSHHYAPRGPIYRGGYM
jgi:hypothetical protein